MTSDISDDHQHTITLSFKCFLVSFDGSVKQLLLFFLLETKVFHCRRPRLLIYPLCTASLAYSILPSTLFSSVVAVLRKFVNLSENSVPLGPNRHHFPAMEPQKITYFLPFSSEDAKFFLSFWPQKF